MLSSLATKVKYIVIALTAPVVNQGSGDRNASLSIVNFIESSIKDKYTKEVECREVSTNDIATIVKDKNSKCIVVATGADAISKINESEAIGNLDNATIIVSSHQYSDVVKNAIGIANIISVPSHAITSAQIAQITGKSKYAKAIGASTSITEVEIEDNYKKLKPEFDEFTHSNETAVMLFGGDATIVDSTEKKLLTVESAKQMGEFVADDMNKLGITKLILTDGPRAGAHLGRKDGQTNPVIESFIKALKEKNIEVLYKPFIMDSVKRSSEPSAYRALLHSGFKRYYYSEESISTGFEMGVFSDNIKGNAVAVEGSSTLDDHKAFAKQLKDMGYISIAEIKEDGKYQLNEPDHPADKPIDRDINNKNIFSALETTLFKYQSKASEVSTEIAR